MSRVVLVTGCTGFLGSALCRELAGAGYAVHGLCRATSDRGRLEGLDVALHVGDLEDRASLDRALGACAERARAAGDDGPWLVHNAAVVSYRTADRDLQVRVNHHGTLRVLEAARAAGVTRAVHVSSVVAVGAARGDETLDEDAAWNVGHLGVDYCDTKRRAEVEALLRAGPLDLRVVNPGAIFGPAAEGTNTLRFLRQLGEGRIGRLAPPGGMSVVGLEDCARGTRLALERGRAGRRYVLTERYLSSRELFELAGRVLGDPRVRRPWASVPRALWPALPLGARVRERLLGPLVMATPQALTMLGRTFRCSGERARRELGWEPRPFEAVLTETVARLRATGHLPTPAAPGERVPAADAG